MSFSYNRMRETLGGTPSCNQWERNEDNTAWRLVGSYDPTSFIAYIVQKIRASANTYIPDTSRPRGYFGKWRYVADPGGGRPPPLAVDIEDHNRPSSGNFDKLQREGKIVVSAMRASKLVITADPVEVPSSDVLNGTQSLSMLDFPELWETKYPVNNTYYLRWEGTYISIRCSQQVSRFVGSGWTLPTIPDNIWEAWTTKPVIDGSLVTKAMVDLNSETMDLLTELAELPDTLALARDTLGLFRNKGRNLQKLLKEARDALGGEKSLSKLADRGAQIRLLYRYGILPLSYTLEDIRKVLNESFKRSYVKASSDADSIFDFDLTGWTFQGTTLSNDKVWLKRRLDPNSSLQQTQAVFGFNIPRTLWEITPWSLVVDWFVNVGDYLVAINPMPSLEEKGTYSARRSVTGTYISQSNSDIRFRIEFQHYDRIIIEPTDYICLSFDPLINTDRALDALAFSWQILRKGITRLKR